MAYNQEEQSSQQYPGEKAGNLSREPSYVQNDGLNNGEYAQQGHSNGPTLLSSDNRDGIVNQEHYNQQNLMPQAQGEQEYQGRENAHVLPHDQYAQQVGEQQHPNGLDYGQSMQTGEQVYENRTIGEPIHQQPLPQQQQYQQQPQQGYAGVGASGYQPQEDSRDMANLQPSRTYSTYGQQGGQPVTAGLAPINTQNNATAVGSSFQDQPLSSASAQDGLQRRSTIASAAGPTTAVLPVNNAKVSSPTNVSGGGLGAALATSGHNITSTDKKALKAEIKNEAKFEKQLAKESKHENEEIGVQLKLTKASFKNAEKSAKHEAAYRKTYDKAIQREVKAKKYLLKVTNEYNKVAADLESATKEMEIRRNQHLADVQTRDADQSKLEELRTQKGKNDMEREARHGDSLTKQAQAKRALSMSKRKSMI